jgi:hypothetical protein
MSTTKKAIELSAELADELRKRFGTIFTSIVEGSDSNGNPTIVMSDGTPVAGEQNVVVRTKAMPWTLATDVLGLAAGRYTPHVIDVCVEASTVAGCPLVLASTLIPLMATVTKRGTQVDTYLTAHATVPSVANLDTLVTAGTIDSSYQPELYWGMLAMQ